MAMSFSFRSLHPLSPAFSKADNARVSAGAIPVATWHVRGEFETRNSLSMYQRESLLGGLYRSLNIFFRVGCA
jgi:hypothetical protein